MTSCPPRLLRKPGSLSFRLYMIAGVATGLVGALAVACVLFVDRTAKSATGLHAYVVEAVLRTAEIGLDLERHGKVIERSLKRESPSQIDEDRRQAEHIARSIAILLVGETDPFLQAIRADIPQLVESSRAVFKSLAASNRDGAVAALAQYRIISVRLQDQIILHRHSRLVRAKDDLSRLVESGDSFLGWVLVSAGAAVLLIGPLSLAIARGIMLRIKKLTDIMRRLANSETSVTVPSIRDSDEVGEMARAVAVFKANAIALKQNQAYAQSLNRWLDIALNNMARGLSLFSTGEKLIVCNRRYAEMYGLPPGLTRPGTPFSEIIAFARRTLDEAAEDDGPDAPERWIASYRNTIAAGAEFAQMRRCKDGRVFHVTCQPLAQGGWVDLHEEVTEKLRSEERIVELARLDNLTGLSNRRHFHEEIEATIRDLAQGKEFAVLWIDLDKFKDVNDTYGHPCGDALLCLVAERLRTSVRGTDFVARLGGDEFAIIMRGAAACRDAAAALAGRLCNMLSRPCEVAGHTVNIGASIGIAMSPDGGRSAEDLMRNADVALYRAKGDGRGGYVFFSGELERSLQKRRRLETDLRTAVRANQLELYYQPIIDLKAGTVASCEALMRWTHPELGPISPAEFIPLAEETGLIGALGAWAVREACSAASRWPGTVGVSVNLSAAQFASTDLVAITESALADSGLAANRLELEVTETLLLQDEPKTRETLHDLRHLGVSIALDDFGTGYSSLSYLRNYPFDTLKIDQAFVRDINQREGSVAIVKAINELARSLGMCTVAEGVESLAHLEQVRAAGCTRAQGYYFSRPVPEASLADVLTGCASRAAA